MGSGASAVSNEGTVEEVCQRILKTCSYYIDDEENITDQEIELARAAWQTIVEDRSSVYLELRDTEGFEATSCLSWYYDSFFRISAEHDQASQELYKVVNNLKVQIRALVGMVSSSLNMFKKPETVNKTLRKIAHGHFQKGVKAYQYPLAGHSLFLTFKYCLGPGWDPATERAWYRIFSKILKEMVRVAVTDEKAGEIVLDPEPGEETPKSACSNIIKLPFCPTGGNGEEKAKTHDLETTVTST